MSDHPDPAERLTSELAAVPAWLRKTAGEPRWAVGAAVLVAIALQLVLPRRYQFGLATWPLAGLEGLLFIGLVIANPVRIERSSKPLRAVSLALACLIAVANGGSAVVLVRGLLRGSLRTDSPAVLLGSGGAIWLTNVLVFALLYWELDRGGPIGRMNAVKSFPDMQFPQMTAPDLAPKDWEPGFVDYLYLALTNATAFSPTDVMPLTRWAKLMMALQSLVSLVIVALVIARAINILK